MVSLGGLSAVFPGYQKARESGSQSDLREIALQDLQLDQAGSVALGKTFQAMMPGAQPLPGMQGPGMQGGPPPGMAGGAPPPGGVGAPPQPPMQPGQPSVPMQQAPQGPQGGMLNFPASGGGMLQGGNQRLSQALQGAQPQPPPQGAAGPTGGMPPPQARPPVGAGGGDLPPPQGQFDLNTAAAAIAKANPGIRPEILVHALGKAMPYLNAQAQNQVRQAMMEIREQNIVSRERIAAMQEGGRQGRFEEGEAGRMARAQLAADTSSANAKLRSDTAMKTAETRAQSGQNIQQEAKDIVDGIERGITPPSLVGLYRARPAVEAEAARRNVNLTQLQLQFKRAEKQISTLNGPQMTRFSGLATSVVNTIDEVRSLAKEMELGGIPFANQAELAYYAQTQGNTPNGQLVARYIGAINTLKEEFANLAQGGYAPTESVWKLANKQINENYGVKQLGASLDEIQRLINYRVQAIPNFQTLGPGAANPYVGGGQASPPGVGGQPPAAAPGLPPPPPGYTVQ